MDMPTEKKHKRTCHVISFQLLFSSVQLIHDYRGFEVYALFCFVLYGSVLFLRTMHETQTM